MTLRKRLFPFPKTILDTFFWYKLTLDLTALAPTAAFQATNTTVVKLYDILIKTINNLGLDLQNFRGQAYDGATNVSGLHTLVKSQYLKALFSHYAAII